MSAEAILADIHNHIQNPVNLEIDLNQRLPDDRSIIEAFVAQSDSGNISGLLGTIIFQVTTQNKHVTIDFTEITQTGNSLFKEIITKSVFDFNLSIIITNIFAIDSRQPQHVDWDAPLFGRTENNNLLLELARLGLDNALRDLVSIKTENNLPLVNVNAQNDNGQRAIDYIKERIDNGGLPPEMDNGEGIVAPVVVELAPGIPNPAAALVPVLRNAGSVEPKMAFVPAMAKLNVENVHDTANATIVAQILERLHQRHKDIDIDVEIAEIKDYFKDSFPVSFKITVQEDEQDAQKTVLLSPHTPDQTKALTRLGEFESNVNIINEHNNTWHFRDEIAYIWREAKQQGNQISFAMTFTDLEGCNWGQLVNLCNTITGSDAIDLSKPDLRTNEEVLKKILAGLHAEFPAVDKDMMVQELRDFVRRNSDESKDLVVQIIENIDRFISVPTHELHNVALDFRELISLMWMKAKSQSHEKELLETMRSLDDNPWVQVLKIAHIAEIPYSRNVIDFDPIIMSEIEQNKIAHEVVIKLRAKNLPFSTMQKLLKDWVDGHSKVEVARHGKLEDKAIYKEQAFIDGIFNEVFIDRVRREKGPQGEALAYSKDFAEWAKIVKNIVVMAAWSEPGSGNDIYDILKYDSDLEVLIDCVNEVGFLDDITAYVEHKGEPINLSCKDQNGVSLLVKLVQNLTEATPNFAEIVKLITTSNDLLLASWAEEQIEGIHFFPQPEGMSPMPMPYFGPIPALEIFYNKFQHLACVGNSCHVPMLRVLLSESVKNSGVLDRLKHFVHTHPTRDFIERFAKGEAVDLDGYIAYEQYRSFVFQNSMHLNFFERLEEYTEENGRLDLSAQVVGYSRPLVFDLLMPHIIHTSDTLKSVLKILASDMVIVDWSQKNGDFEGAQDVVDAFAPAVNSIPLLPGELGRLLFPVISKATIQSPAIGLKFTNMLPPYITAVIEEITACGGDLEKHTLINSVNLADFGRLLEEYTVKHGLLDLSQKDKDGKSLISNLIDKTPLVGVMQPDFFEIITSNNPNVNINWFEVDSDGVCPIQRLDNKFLLFGDENGFITCLMNICSDERNKASIFESGFLEQYNKDHPGAAAFIMGAIFSEYVTDADPMQALGAEA